MTRDAPLASCPTTSGGAGRVAGSVRRRCVVRLLGSSALIALAACAPDFRPAARYLGQTLPTPREPVFERRRSYFDSAATQLAREHGVLILHDGSTLAHGRDVAWYSNGRTHYEREFERGEPRGRWRSWFENGVLESETLYEPGRTSRMNWWRDDGTLSSQGSHVMGLREGEWASYFPNGQIAARGRYLAGKRYGLWTYFDDEGRILECGEYSHGERVGAWER